MLLGLFTDVMVPLLPGSNDQVPMPATGLALSVAMEVAQIVWFDPALATPGNATT